MANGPHSADVAQRYILQAMRATGLAEKVTELMERPHTHNGMEEWSIGEVFEDEVLRGFDPQDFQDEALEMPDYGFRALDQIYGSIDTTSDGNKRLEGLRALDIGWDFPVEGRTERDWKQNYREAGLTDNVDGELQVSREGQVFLNTDPRDYELDGVGVEDVGEVYRDLTTKKLDEDVSGRKLEALFMYGAGMTHREVSDATGLTYGTTKNFAYAMKDDHDLLTDNYRLTPEGFEFANMVLDQLDLLEEATEARVQEEYGAWSDVDPSDFGGNEYMAQALKDSAT
ncbi:hypothetical protein ACK3SF_03125 [Candidatus Nanosalina sp. VS9-1]|uniref:hypothetical protein n=1 Tax=Candidatus Nanosalina sp. VS9-1 TaxID=3388566 RepID=UPI0039E11844